MRWYSKARKRSVRNIYMDIDESTDSKHRQAFLPVRKSKPCDHLDDIPPSSSRYEWVRKNRSELQSMASSQRGAQHLLHSSPIVALAWVSSTSSATTSRPRPPTLDDSSSHSSSAHARKTKHTVILKLLPQRDDIKL
jgi:hypothetical protein